MKDYIQEIIKPKIEGDGGEVDFISLENGTLKLLFQGECSKCLILHRCTDWISEEIKRDLLQDVRVEAVRKKPFFWDN